MHHTYAVALDNFFLDAFKGTGLATSVYALQFGAKSKVENIVLGNNWWLSSLWNEGNISIQSISSTMDSMATSFTNHVRTIKFDSASNSSKPGQEDAPSFVLGTVYETTVCTRFDWKWLLFPIVLVFATLVLLAFTVVSSYYDSQQLPIWKSSLLPLLFYGFERKSQTLDQTVNGEDEKGERDGLLGKEQLSAFSSEKIVRFRRSEKGAGFEECVS